MAKSRLSMAITDTKRNIRSLDADIKNIKSTAEAIKKGEGSLPSFYEKDTPETRKDYANVYLKREKYQSLVSQRTQAKKELAQLEKIKEMRKNRKITNK